MATSSSQRQSIVQWQRFMTLVKKYIYLQPKNSSAINILPAHPMLKSAVLTQQEYTAIWQALTICVHQVRVLKTAGDIVKTSTIHRRKRNTNSTNICADAVREFLSDGCITNNEINSANSNHAAITPHPGVATKHDTNLYACSHHHIINAHISSVASPTAMIQHSGRSYIRISQPLNVNKSTSAGTASCHAPNRIVPAPTYTSMRFPRSLSSKSSKSYDEPNEELSGKLTNLSTSVIATPSAPVVPEFPDSELQRALKIVNSYIPLSLSQISLSFMRSAKSKSNNVPVNLPSRPKWLDTKRDVVSKTSVDSRTRHLVQGLTVEGEGATLRRLCDLSSHLRTYPTAYTAAVKLGGIGRVLRILEATKDKHVALEAKVVLGLMGYSGPVSGRGLRILAIDGGGVRGLVAIQLLRKLEEVTGKAVHEMFDMICGVSTGAIVAVLIGIHRRSPLECEVLYRDLSEKVFTQTTLRGATSLVINNSYYDSNAWDNILRQNMGEAPLLQSLSSGLPKVCLVASHAVRSLTQAYLFRNYVLPHRVASHYSGTSRALLWQAVRASAAAPGYFSEFQLDDKVLMDGGIIVNNPAAIAVHEARQLWPDSSFQCVVSLGTGRFQPVEPAASLSMNWGNKLRSVINSATDTEGVHTIMHDLLPGNVYFRFNPHLSDEFGLDEIRPDRLAVIMRDTELYARKNATKFQEAAAALSLQKTPYHKTLDYIKKAQYLHGFDS